MIPKFSIQGQIKDVRMGRPHVVILGAGASVAAFPHGDKFGRTLPLMNNLVDIVHLKPILKNYGIKSEHENFEEIYSELSSENKHQPLLSEIEERIYDYFSELEIPDNPTLYDHLVLSLRRKDIIATFNWDPLLVQAYYRNQDKFDLPHLAYLHGNVAVGYCKIDRIKGLNGSICRKCKQPYIRSTLLYPIKQKDYRNDHFISLEWKDLEKSLKEAYMLTIFGYSAPKTDVAAIDIMKKAFDGNSVNNLLDTEIIDIKSEKELEETWKDFMYGLHYSIDNDFYNSCIPRHPRRTCEGLWNATQEGKLLDDNNIPRNYNFNELWKWLVPLREAENNENKG